MDENHPKRRKDKYNPYTIGTTDDGRHWLTFLDGQGIRHHFEISNVVFSRPSEQQNYDGHLCKSKIQQA